MELPDQDPSELTTGPVSSCLGRAGPAFSLRGGPANAPFLRGPATGSLFDGASTLSRAYPHAPVWPRHAPVGPSAACWLRLSGGWSPQLAARTRAGGVLVPPAVTVAGADAGRALPRGARLVDCQEVTWCVGRCVGAPFASPVAARSKQDRSCDFFASAATWLWPAWLVISFASRASVAVGDGARRRCQLLASAFVGDDAPSRRQLLPAAFVATVGRLSCGGGVDRELQPSVGCVAAGELPVAAIVGDAEGGDCVGGRIVRWGWGGGRLRTRRGWHPCSGGPAAMVSASVEEAALATCTSFVEAVGERRIGAVTLQQVKLLLKQVELFSKENKDLNWHVHVSGYDQKGKLFWLPIYEDDAVLKSAASNVLGQVYRYVESGSCMEATAASIMSNDPAPLPLAPSLRDAPPLALPPGLRGAGAASGEGDDGGERDTVVGGGDRMGGAAGLAGIAGGAGGTAAGVQGGTIVRAGAAGGDTGGLKTADAQLAIAQAAAAAIVDADVEENLPPAGVRPRAPGATSAAVAGRGGSGALDDIRDDPLAGRDDNDSGEDDEDERAAAAAGARPTRQPVVKRQRRDWAVTAPPTPNPPADILPSDAAVNMAKAVITASDGMTLLRKALVIGNKAVAGTWSWRRARLSLPWWPRKPGTEQLWPLTVVVDNSLVKLADPKQKATKGVVKAVLPWLNIPRAFSVERRIAEFLLLVDKSDQANADITGFIAGFNPTALPPAKVRSSSGLSLSGLSDLRAAPRIAPSPAAFAGQQADPRRPGQLFSGAPYRPAGWVANGSPRPTSQTRMPPPELPAPLPPSHPAAIAQSGRSVESAASTAAAAAKAAVDNLRATLVARAASNKPRASSSGSRASAMRAGALATTGSSRGSGATPPSPRPPPLARTRSSTPRPAATPSTASPTPPAAAAPAPSSEPRAAAKPSAAATAPPAPAAPAPSSKPRAAAKPSVSATAPPAPAAPDTSSTPRAAATSSTTATAPLAAAASTPSSKRTATTTSLTTATTTPSAASSAASGTAAPGGTYPTSVPPRASNAGSSPNIPGPVPSHGAPTVGDAPPSLGAGALQTSHPPSVSRSPRGAKSSTSPSDASAALSTGASAPSLPRADVSRTTLSCPTSPRPPSSEPSGGRSSLEGSPTAVAVSKAMTRKSAAAPVTGRAAAAPGSAADSGGPTSTSTISRPGSSSRRPPIHPGRPPPHDMLAAPKRSTQVGAKEGAKSGVNSSAKTGARVRAKTAAKPSTKTAAKPSAKTAAKPTAKTAAKPSSKMAAAPSTTTSAKPSALAGADTSTKQSAAANAGEKLVGVSVGGGLPETGDKAPAVETAPQPSGGASARRGRSAFGLAADALRRSTRAGKGTAVLKPAHVLQKKRPAAQEPTATAAPALKRSRRLVDREQRSSAAQKQSAATLSPTEEPSSTTAAPAMRLDDVANRAECTLLSELGVPVATGRLMKERLKVNSRWIDADMTAVELCSILEPSVCYPYSDRYPLVDRRRAAAVHLDSIVGSTVAWSLNCLTLQ